MSSLPYVPFVVTVGEGGGALSLWVYSYLVFASSAFTSAVTSLLSVVLI